VQKKIDPNMIRNAILLSLPRKELDIVFPKLQHVALPPREILNEIAAPIETAYFMDSGVVSIINLMSDGKSVEVGLTGNEGFVGVPLIVGYNSSPTRAIVQIEAAAHKIAAKDLKLVLRKCPGLEKNLQRYAQELSIQAIQIAACNRLHTVDQRLARWLLMCEDRIRDANFALTQEFLSHMLGTRRASVTVAAGILQKAGLITYRRGIVKIVNRAALEKASCECYGNIVRQIEVWRKHSS
jgi:CRP-like cAMP-binding protein